jgi:ribonuclease VapC
LIVVDTSALMAIVLGEPAAAACRSVVADHDEILIAAPNLAEALIVAAGRELRDEMARLVDDLALTVSPLDEGAALAAVRSYLAWGKGFHAAGLNFGDCFAHALAKAHDCPLLFVGDDFARTDVSSALA